MNPLENYKQISLGKLKKAPWNYKIDDADRADKLINNLRRNGQIENLIVRRLDDGTYEVINGNHRLDALAALKQEKAHCYDAGIITTAQAKRIAIETNELRFQGDTLKLAKIVEGLTEKWDLADLATTMPYTEDQLFNYTSLLHFDWSSYEDGFDFDGTTAESTHDGPGGDSGPGHDGGPADFDPPAETLTCPHCGVTLQESQLIQGE